MIENIEFDNPVNRKNLRFWSMFCVIAAIVSMVAIAFVVPDYLLLGLVNTIVFAFLIFYLLAGQFEFVKRPRTVEIGNDGLALHRRFTGKIDKVQYQDIVSIVPYSSVFMSGDNILHTSGKSFVLGATASKGVKEAYRRQVGSIRDDKPSDLA